MSQVNRKFNKDGYKFMLCCGGKTHDLAELEHKGLVNIVAKNLRVDGAQLIRRH